MRKRTGPDTAELALDLGRPNSEPQKRFFTSACKYTCYGGARGGGKTWSARTKACGGALRYPGIRILILRRQLKDMRGTLISPMVGMLPPGLARFNENQLLLTFCNGSTIQFGHLESYTAAVQGAFQGQEFDWIFLEEATQFLESEFRGLAACLRGVNDIPKRFYLTCNPGGIGHAWVKRLFIDRRFRAGENGADYCFIKATVDDNRDLMEKQPDYAAALELLPEDVRAAHRYGDWDALAGTYFSEFVPSVHVCPPFVIPPAWPRYRAFDYGLDMFACLWIAVDAGGRCYVYREYCAPSLTVSEAAEAALRATPPEERIEFTLAPPDLWSRQRETGRTGAEIFAQCGVGLVKAPNGRVQGWLMVKELLRLRKDGRPGLMIFDGCASLREYLPLLQHDSGNPSDCSDEPHEITHVCDALRYFCVSRTLPAERVREEAEEATGADTYDGVMRGGAPTESYFSLL